MPIFLFDMGLPMIFPSIFLMVLALFPVIFVEGYLITKSLQIDGPAGYQASFFANLISTIVGIPVTWFLLAVIQQMTGGGGAYGFDSMWQKIIAFTWQAPWLIPYYEEAPWVGYAAMIFLLIPYFLSSWYIEYIVARRFLANRLPINEDADSEAMRKFEIEASYSRISDSIRNANLVTYGCLALLLLIPLLITIRSR